MMDIRELIRGSQYSDKYQVLEALAQNELPKIQIMFPYYTDHGIPHCEKLFELISEILPSDIDPKLTKLEAFLLGGAIMLHDIGMVPKDDEKPDKKIQQEIRENHHHRCKEYILANYCMLGLDDKHAEIIADIAFAHRGRNYQNILEYPDEKTVGIGTENRIRIQLLSALLRVGDECHVTHDRIESLIGDQKQLDPESQKHFWKHFSTDGISCSPKGEILEISATITKNEIRQALEEVRKKIEDELDGVKIIFQRYNIGIRTAKINLQESESLQIENQGLLHDFVMKILKNGSLQKSDYIKESKVSIAHFQNLINMSAERGISVDIKDDSIYLELNPNNLIAVSRMFLDSQVKFDFLRLDAVQQAVEKTADSIIRDRFYIETDEVTLKQILAFAKIFPSVLQFIFISDNSYYVTSFKYMNKYEKIDFSNIMHSRFISEIITNALRDLHDPSISTKFSEYTLGEYTSNIELSITLKDHRRFHLFNSSRIMSVKLAKGESVEAGQPVYAADIPAELGYADQLHKEDNFIEAKKWYEEIIRKDSTCVPAINNLGLVYKDLGHHKQAIELLDKIINELEPELPQAYLNKGTSLASLGKTNEAIGNYDMAIQKKPDYFEAWYWKGAALFGCKDFAGAKDCFEQAIHIASNSGVYLCLSKCFFELDNKAEAMSNVDKAIKVDSININARLWKAELLRQNSDWQNALSELSELYKKCYEIMTFQSKNRRSFDIAIKGYLNAVDLKAVTLIEMGDYEECVKFVDEMLFLISDYFNFWYNKACALAHLHRKEEMIESLNQSIILDSNSKDKAKEDKDFQDYWCDEEFKALINGG